MKATTPKEVLIATKWILTNFDWCQGSWYKAADDKAISSRDILEGRVQLNSCCLDGALSLVDCDVSAAWSKANDLLEQDEAVHGMDGLVHWNDTKGRTKEQVINLLNRAIEKA
jgi:hypothetical protein